MFFNYSLDKGGLRWVWGLGRLCFFSILSWVLLLLDHCRWEGKERSLEARLSRCASCVWFLQLPVFQESEYSLVLMAPTAEESKRWALPSCWYSTDTTWAGGPVWRCASRQSYVSTESKKALPGAARESTLTQKDSTGQGLTPSFLPQCYAPNIIRGCPLSLPYRHLTQTCIETGLFLNLIVGVIFIDFILKAVFPAHLL